MGARVCAEMRHAQELLRKGLTAAEASRQAGVTKGAISLSEGCRRIIAEVKTTKAAQAAAKRAAP